MLSFLNSCSSEIMNFIYLHPIFSIFIGCIVIFRIFIAAFDFWWLHKSEDEDKDDTGHWVDDEELPYETIRQVHCMIPTRAECGKTYIPYDHRVDGHIIAYNVDNDEDMLYLD